MLSRDAFDALVPVFVSRGWVFFGPLDHLNDQLAALKWLRQQSFIRPDRIAVAGNSFGGVEAVLGAEKGNYRA